MIKRKIRTFGMFLFALVSLMFPSGDAFARGGGGGGRGGGGGGRGGGGGGRGGARGAAARALAGSAGRAGRNNNGKRTEQEKLARREERMGRVAVARLVYAKRERERAWDSETEDRFARLLRRILGGSSE